MRRPRRGVLRAVASSAVALRRLRPDLLLTYNWGAIEWAAAGQLTGITRDTLKPGDHVIITGNPGRTVEDHRLRMRSILRPKDGFKWSGDFQ